MKSRQILLTAGLVLFAFAALGNGVDRYSARNLGVERSVPSPFRAQADRSAALIAITRQQVAASLANASAAVDRDPVDPDATALLGTAQMMAGQDLAAATTFRVAARFGWRNAATQLYWYNVAIQSGDYAVAADRADALLRVHPGYPLREALLQPLEATPSGRRMLVEHLRRQPGWISSYLNANQDASSATLDHRVEVISGLSSKGSRLGCEAVANFATILLNKDRRGDAQRVWSAHCPERPVNGLIADPQFASIDNPEQFPFTWRIQRSGDVEVRSEIAQGGARSLVVRNASPAIREVMDQALALPAGTYRLRLAVDDEKRGEPAPLLASLGCGRSAPYPSEVQGALTGTGQILRIGDCKRQQLGIWLAPGQTAHIKFAQLERVM